MLWRPLFASGVVVSESLVSDSVPCGESSDGVGGAGLFAGQHADGFVDHGVVAGLGGCYVFGFLEYGEGCIFVAVDEVATGEVYAVVADAFPLGGGRDGEGFGAFDGFGAVQHFYGEPDRPDVDVGEAEA